MTPVAAPTTEVLPNLIHSVADQVAAAAAAAMWVAAMAMPALPSAAS